MRRLTLAPETQFGINGELLRAPLDLRLHAAILGASGIDSSMRPELIRASELLQKQTPEAVEKAIGLMQSTVYSFSMKVCGHPEDAEDTMQDVLFRSLGHLKKLQSPEALAAWLYTVTRNRCWRMRRKPANTRTRTLSLDELMPDDAELSRLLEDAAASPEEHALGVEQHELLHGAVLRIPPQLRIVLVLHDMEELDTDQVAQILALKEGTVRVRLHRARLAVRKQMGALLQGTQSKKQRKQSTRRKPGSVHKRPEACRTLFANLSEYLDDRVEPRTCDEMRKHIEDCPSCVAFLRDLRAAIERCRSIETPCDAVVASRLRTVLTREYLRMLKGTAGNKAIYRM